MSNLTPAEKEFIQRQEQYVSRLMTILEKVRQFKIDDVCIAYEPVSAYNSTRTLWVNTYGSPKKFKVVAIDSNGVPFFKELNKHGKTAGQLISSIDYDDYTPNLTWEFEIDPDMADSLILDDMDGYDPTSLHRDKADTFKEIALHNKDIKLSFDTNNDLCLYLLTLRVGDVLWRSNRTSWTITAIQPLPVMKNGRFASTYGYNDFLTVQTNKGKILNLSFNDLLGIALYSGQPRSYKELRDPK